MVKRQQNVSEKWLETNIKNRGMPNKEDEKIGAGRHGGALIWRQVEVTED